MPPFVSSDTSIAELFFTTKLFIDRINLLQKCYTKMFKLRIEPMKKNRISKKVQLTYIMTTLVTLFICLLFMEGYTPFEKTGDNLFHVRVNGVEVGNVGDVQLAERLLIEARRKIAMEKENLVFLDADMVLDGEEVLWGRVDKEEDVLERMEAALRTGIHETMHQSYTVKVNEYLVNLSGAQEAQALLQAAIDKYDTAQKYQVNLVQDSFREFNVLTTEVVETENSEDEMKIDVKEYAKGGVEDVLAEMGLNVEKEESDFDDFVLGLKSMDFEEKVEIVESYLPESQLTPLQTAIDEVTKEQEMPGEYEVVAGDTLSEISLKVNIPMDKIIEMNSEILQNENSTIRIGDILIITVPEPELSVTRVEQNYYEETYDADIVYVDEDSWYTYQTEVLQQPSAGFRKIVANVTYLNEKQISREILKEEVVAEAVPKIVKRGTKTPPTFIKPVSGGRLSSPFGKRKAPKRGASTYHKGMDWALPTGTAVYASCGGTVSKAGWGSGYGYVVYIRHEGGSETRYAHLSKVLVKVGETVKQGERIALSGNTGVSTGPHLHFELIMNGSHVNPAKYLQ